MVPIWATYRPAAADAEVFKNVRLLTSTTTAPFDSTPYEQSPRTTTWRLGPNGPLISRRVVDHGTREFAFPSVDEAESP
jgi:hypothetical protein